MRVTLIKSWTPHKRELKPGTEVRVTNECGRDLIEKGIAEPLDGYTKAEIETVEQLIADQDPEIKKVTPKKSSKN